MPCLELKVAAEQHPKPATRLRSLLEKPGAALLRRNHIAEALGHDDALLHNRIRIAAVLAVDLTDPPQEPDAPAPPVTEPAEGQPVSAEPSDALASSFAKGLEIWMTDGARTACVYADAEEIAGALTMFDAYLRLARYQPAFQRLDQRIVGLHYAFREGLSVGIQGNPAENSPDPASFFHSAAAIPEFSDFRQERFTVRLPNSGINYFHELLRSASAWLEENSYPNILGSK